MKWLTIIILKQWFESQIIRISISYDDFLRMNWYIRFVIVSIHSFLLISANVYFNSTVAFKNLSREYVFKMRSILICIIQSFILILNLFVIYWSRFQRIFFIIISDDSFADSNRIRFDQRFILFENDTIDNLMHITENVDQKLIESFKMFANSSESKNF